MFTVHQILIKILVWDVSSVTNMNQMFRDAINFNQDIGSWDVSNVTDIASMFLSATIFNQDLSGWCVASISSEPNNFSNSSALTSITNLFGEPALLQPQMLPLRFRQVTG